MEHNNDDTINSGIEGSYTFDRAKNSPSPSSTPSPIPFVHTFEEIKENIRGGSRAAATSKVELFVIIVNSFQPLTIITKSSFLDVAAVLDPPLNMPENTAFLTPAGESCKRGR